MHKRPTTTVGESGEILATQDTSRVATRIASAVYFVFASAIGLWAVAPQADAAELAIVIDDVGYNQQRAQRLLRLPGQLTLALLPDAPHAASVAETAHRFGKEVILHQPMEPQRGAAVRSEPRTLTSQMSEAELRLTFEQALDKLPNLAGVSNHTGSLLTAHPRAMRTVMSVIKARGLFFLDSRTTSETVALQTAVASNVPAVRRDVFLDHTLTYTAIDASFRKALRLSIERGSAVVIAHPHEASIAYLERALTALPPGVELVSLDYLARSSYRAALAPGQIAASAHRSPGP